MNEKMNIGMPFWYGDRPLHKRFKLANTLGFDYIEISLDYPYPNEELNQINILSDKHNIKPAFHASPSLMPTHPIANLQQTTLETLKENIDTISIFEPLYFNIHYGSHTPTLEFKKIRRATQKTSIQALTNLTKHAMKQQVPITIENIPTPFLSSIEDLEYILNNIQNLRFCLDIGHAIRPSCRYKNKPVQPPVRLSAWTEQLGNHMLVTHLHDYVKTRSGKILDHLPIGKGKLNLNQTYADLQSTNCDNILLEFLSIHQPVTADHFKKGLQLTKQQLKT